MTPVPAHLVGWATPKVLNEDGDHLEVTVRCPCGSDRLEFYSAGPLLPPGTCRSCRCVAQATCTACGEHRVLFDNLRHGWDALVYPQRLAKLRPMPLRPYRCPKCGAAEQRGLLRLKIFADERTLILYSGGRIDWARRFDAFTTVEVGVECCGCGDSSPGWQRYETSAADIPTSARARYRPLSVELTVLWDGERVGRIRVTGRHVQGQYLIGKFFPEPCCAEKAPPLAAAQRALDARGTPEEAGSDEALDRFLEQSPEIARHIRFAELPIELDEITFDGDQLCLFPLKRNLREYAHRHPPRCIKHLNPVPLTGGVAGLDHSGLTAYFRVSCACGEGACYALGYFWEGEGPTPQAIFVSPLAIECPSCGRVSELIDTRRHGYNGEQGGDCNMTGEGPRTRFPCPQCGEVPFAVIPGFAYDGPDYDPLAPDARPQDFFGWFSLYGECGRCGRLASVASFECA